MKIQKKFLAQIVIFMTILLTGCQVFATDILSYLGTMELSDEFKEYMNLSKEQQNEQIMPRAFNVSENEVLVTNPLKIARTTESSSADSYSLRKIIPDNMVIKDQGQTNTCWTFSSLAMLESTLALKDYKNGVLPIIYDFSERHMEYATSRTFKNGKINTKGFNREIDDGGSYILYVPYLTNGTGAISEESMKFNGNEQTKIDLSELNNKTVISQVNDIEFFSATNIAELQQKMKNHLKNYGAIDAAIHGAALNSDAYNNETGAIYCNDSDKYPANHAVAIIGWDDDYSKSNFLSDNQPTNNGAWIIKNSWGAGEKYTLEEMKQLIYDNFTEQCKEYGWTSAELIPDEDTVYFFSNNGYTITDDNEAVLKIGDEGFMYVSYEDVNIYEQLTGISNAQYGTSYENLYQYDEYAGVLGFKLNTSKVYLATIFDKKTTKNEYLTQVSIFTQEPYTTKVYVNPNGTSTQMADLQQIELKDGETESFGTGYHTIEFLNPLKIEGEQFVVVLEIQGTEADNVTVMMEFNPTDYAKAVPAAAEIAETLSVYDNVTVESGKCFWSVEEGVNQNQWVDTSVTLSLSNGNWPNFDTTIKAFTTSKVLENITVTTPPTKTKYVVGQDFDSTGMVVKANYANGESIVINDYKITDGKKLSSNQREVTITYQNKSVKLPITVVENKVENIKITKEPDKTEYLAGDDFDSTGMIVEATYTDGNKKTITNYKITDGKTLKNGQTVVTIEFEGKTTTQAITVNKNAVVKLEIKQKPTKVNYVAGQNFDTTGMIVMATYENGTEKEVSNYTVKDGKNLAVSQTTITIEYEGLTVKQQITVIERIMTGISVKTKPEKTEYIEGREKLDLTGGIIEISYNDGKSEEIEMTSEEVTASGFDNTVVGKQTITLTYKEKTTTFEIKIVELAKPTNSNFNNMQGNVTRIRTYSYTDKNKKEHTILNIELANIAKATENEEMKYYYYLSANNFEKNISDWVEITNEQATDTGFTFEINTLNLSNYDELADANHIYLYIREVATRNNLKSEVIPMPVKIETGNVDVEEFVNDEKKVTIVETKPAEKTDDTKAPGTIPKAGKDLLMVIFAITLVLIGKVAYSKYKDIQLK